jgi:hypothetical protein
MEQLCTKLSAKTLQKYSKGNFLIAPSLCRLVKDGENLVKGRQSLTKKNMNMIMDVVVSLKNI